MVQILGLWERIVNVYRAVEFTTLLLYLPMKDKFYKGSCSFGCKALFVWKCQQNEIFIGKILGLICVTAYGSFHKHCFLIEVGAYFTGIKGGGLNAKS